MEYLAKGVRDIGADQCSYVASRRTKQIHSAIRLHVATRRTTKLNWGILSRCEVS